MQSGVNESDDNKSVSNNRDKRESSIHIEKKLSIEDTPREWPLTPKSPKPKFSSQSSILDLSLPPKNEKAVDVSKPRGHREVNERSVTPRHFSRVLSQRTTPREINEQLLIELIKSKDKEITLQQFREMLEILAPEVFSEWRLVRKNRNVLHWLAYYNRTDMMAALIEKWPEYDLNPLDASDCTPLHLAAREGNFESVEWLLEHGAIIDPINKKRHTPQRLAEKNGYNVIVSYFESFESENSDLLARFHKGDLSLLTKLQGGQYDWYKLIPSINQTFPQYIQSYSQTKKFNAKHWDLYLKIQHILYAHSEEIERHFLKALEQPFIELNTENVLVVKESPECSLLEVALIGALGQPFENYLETDVLIDQKLLVDDELLVLFGALRETERPLQLIDKYTFGMIDKYAIPDILNALSILFPKLNQVDKLVSFYLVKVLLLADTNNIEILSDDFNKSWLAFSEKVLELGEIGKYLFGSLSDVLKAKRHCCFPNVVPLQREMVANSVLQEVLVLEKDQTFHTRIRDVFTVEKIKKGDWNAIVKEMADYIFQVNAAYFLCASHKELADEAWKSEARSPNITVLTSFFNELSHMVVCETLEYYEIDFRARVLRFYTEVAYHLIFKQRTPDYQGGFAIYSALNNSAISRLKKTHAILADDGAYQEKLTHLAELFEGANNFKILRNALLEKPGIPCLAITTRDKTFVQEGLKTTELLGQCNLNISHFRHNLLLKFDQRFFLEPDLLERVTKYSGTAEETLYEKSCFLEPRMLQILPGTELIAIKEHLDYRLQAAFPLTLKFDKKIYDGHKAVEKLTLYLKNILADEAKEKSAESASSESIALAEMILDKAIDVSNQISVTQLDKVRYQAVLLGKAQLPRVSSHGLLKESESSGRLSKWTAKGCINNLLSSSKRNRSVSDAQEKQAPHEELDEEVLVNGFGNLRISHKKELELKELVRDDKKKKIKKKQKKPRAKKAGFFSTLPSDWKEQSAKIDLEEKKAILAPSPPPSYTVQFDESLDLLSLGEGLSSPRHRENIQSIGYCETSSLTHQEEGEREPEVVAPEPRKKKKKHTPR